MNDLISRKARLEEIEILMNGAEQHQTGDYKQGYVTALVELKMLAEQADVAYDPDIVAKRIKECTDKLANNMRQQLDRGITYGTKRAITHLFQLLAENIVEIVKKGGME